MNKIKSAIFWILLAHIRHSPSPNLLKFDRHPPHIGPLYPYMQSLEYPPLKKYRLQGFSKK